MGLLSLEGGDSANFFRTASGLCSAGLCLAVIGYVLYNWAKTPAVIPRSEAPEKHDQRADAIKIRLDLSGKLFDVGVIFLGVLWGLVLAENVHVQFSRWQDEILFSSSNALILSSLFCHLRYKNRVATLLWDLAPHQPDISTKVVDYLFQAQWILFFAGLLTGLITIFSVKMI